MGITCDAVYALKVWAEQLAITSYPFCSDFWPHGAVSRQWGVFDEEIGRPERAIIVVDPQGVVRYIDVHQLREVPDAEEIAEELQKLEPKKP